MLSTNNGPQLSQHCLILLYLSEVNVNFNLTLAEYSNKIAIG